MNARKHDLKLFLVILGIVALFLASPAQLTKSGLNSSSSMPGGIAQSARSLTPTTVTPGAQCGSSQPSGTTPQLMPAICVTPNVLCNPGSSACAKYPASARVHLWVNATQNSTFLPWIQVVFVVETTLYDGVYDPSASDHGSDPCGAPCAESVGVPYLISNVAQITHGITAKNAGVQDSPHVTFSMVDYFSNYNPTSPGTDGYDDGDGSEYNVDVSSFQSATTFSNTVTSMANANPSPLFGGGCGASGWDYANHIYCDSDFSDNFLHTSMITAIYGGLHGSGLGWVTNSTTYHVIVWLGSSLPRDPSYAGDLCPTYSDYASSCPEKTSTSEPAYTYGSGITEPAGETLSSLASIASSEHVIIDTIDLPDGMTELKPPNPKVSGQADYNQGTSTQTTTAKTDITNILGAGCYLAQSTGGSWEGPSPSSSGIPFTCSAAATGTSQGNLSDVWYNGWPPTWSSDPSLGWALTNIKFPSLHINYTLAGTLYEQPFEYIPNPGFAMGSGGMSYSCRHNSTDISSKCSSATNYSVSGGHSWDWPLHAMYQNDSWSVSFNITVTNTFPTSKLNSTVPVDLCLNTSMWKGCNGTAQPPYTLLKYTNYTGVSVTTSFPPADVMVVSSSNSVPSLTSVALTPTTVSLLPQGSQAFTATPVCSGGTCPGGTTFVWSLSNKSMGTLSSLTGTIVTFTAGKATGTLQITANGTLNSKTVQSTPATINVVTIVNVKVSPPSATVYIGSAQPFSASPTCTLGACPSGTTYYWTMTNGSMGSLNPATGANITFATAGKTGVVSIFVNATLGTNTVQSTAVPIQVKPGVPTLSSVSVSPPSATLNSNASMTFTATPSCSGGSCPAGTTYAWNLTNSSRGTLSPNTGQSVAFTAGSTPGTLYLFVNATLNGVTQRSNAVTITISKPVVPTLSYVTISPPQANVTTLGSRIFNATPTCSGGTCPAGTVFAWSLTGSLGNLSTSTGPSVTFTAGTMSGNASLSVSATLNGITKGGGPVTISVIGLLRVSVSPSSYSMPAGSAKTFTATPVCSSATCPAGTTYSWSISQPALGTLSTLTGNPTTFTAGMTAGQLTLTTSATLGGVTVSSSPVTITINSSVVSSLVSVSVSPSPATIQPQSSQTFAATPVCSGTCPSNVTYSWTLSRPLGALSAATGNSIVFTAGGVPGSLNLFVNATLGVSTVRSAAVPITITGTTQTIQSVALSPTSITMVLGNTTTFTAEPSCGGTCTAQVAYVWSVSNALGSLSRYSGSSSTVFTAGNVAGTVTLTVNATLNGKTVTASAVITVISPSPNTTGSSWMGNYTLWALVAVGVIGLVIIALVLTRRLRKMPPEGEDGTTSFVL